jgi:hypothetical protein
VREKSMNIEVTFCIANLIFHFPCRLAETMVDHPMEVSKPLITLEGILMSHL